MRLVFAERLLVGSRTMIFCGGQAALKALPPDPGGPGSRLCEWRLDRVGIAGTTWLNSSMLSSGGIHPLFGALFERVSDGTESACESTIWNRPGSSSTRFREGYFRSVEGRFSFLTERASLNDQAGHAQAPASPAAFEQDALRTHVHVWLAPKVNRLQRGWAPTGQLDWIGSGRALRRFKIASAWRR